MPQIMDTPGVPDEHKPGGRVRPKRPAPDFKASMKHRASGPVRDYDPNDPEVRRAIQQEYEGNVTRQMRSYGDSVGFNPFNEAQTEKVRKLTDHIGRGTLPNRTNSERAEAARQLMLRRRDIGADDNMLELMPQREAREAAGKLKRTAVRGRGQVKVAWDDEPGKYRYHYAPDDKFDAIKRSGGLDPSRAQGYSKGVHFMDSPNEYPAIGDRPMNVYRTPREGRSWGQVATDDFYTNEFVREPEVYTEVNGMPRWSGLSNAYSAASGAKGLYDLLSSFMPGVLPQIQTPVDWIIQDLMRTNSRSPWNPENQLGYTVPA